MDNLLGVRKPNWAVWEYRKSGDCREEPSDLSVEWLAVRGAFKTPILRNVELTGPCIHNDSMSTLEQVVEFYNRGGNFDNPERDADIENLGLSSQQKSDLVAFMKSLTDPCVANEEGPFDHPQLFISDGHVGDEFSVETGQFSASLDADDWKEIPAVGRYGRTADALSTLKPFVDVLPSIDIDDGWTQCATTEPTDNGICYQPQDGSTGGITFRFVGEGNPDKFQGGPYTTMVWCLPHMFGLPLSTQGVCEYKPN